MRFILETARLKLRELEEGDHPFIATMRSDPQVMRFWPSPATPAESIEWLSKQRLRYRRDGVGQWLVTDRESAEPLGVTGLMRIDVEGVSEVEVGYMIHRPFWRRGYASEAAAAARDFAFESLRVARLIALIRPENSPSQGVARKIGLIPEQRVVAHAGLPHVVYSTARPSLRAERHVACNS